MHACSCQVNNRLVGLPMTNDIHVVCGGAGRGRGLGWVVMLELHAPILGGFTDD
jgi:hypothetical protein